VPDDGPGSDIVWAISGNVFRANGGIPTTGEAVGNHRIGTLHVSKANAAAAGSVTVAGNLFVTAALGALPVTSGNTLAIATAGAVDTDLDGVEDSVDNCPTVANGLAEAAVIGVATSTARCSGPECRGDRGLEAGWRRPGGLQAMSATRDNCRNERNPTPFGPPPKAFLTEALFFASNQWATLSGGQRDDDHDGYGNRCDAKFTALTGFVGSSDLAQYRPSSGKLRANMTLCGGGGHVALAYDLDDGPRSVHRPMVYRPLSSKQ
jgi:hypothetical protein